MNPDNNVVSRHGYDYVAVHRYAECLRRPSFILKRRFSPFVNTFFAESDQPYMVAPGARARQTTRNLNQVAFNNTPDRKRRTVQVRRVVARRSHLARRNEVLLGQAGARPDRRADRSRRETRRSTCCAPHAIDYMFQASQRNVSGRTDAYRTSSSSGSTSTATSTFSSTSPDRSSATRAFEWRSPTRSTKSSCVRDVDLRHADNGDGRHPGLDVGVRSARALGYPHDPAEARVAPARSGLARPVPTASCETDSRRLPS